MSTLIIYATRHGCTEKAANILAEKFAGDISAVNLKENKKPDLAKAEIIIIGGSIHAGHIQGKIKKFCNKNLDILKQKRLGLFLCCMEEGEKAQEQFDNAYPAELREHASATGLFGGEFNFDMMNFLEKFIIKKIAGTTENVSKFKEEEIEKFAREIK